MIKKLITFILIITLFFTLPVSTSAQANFTDVPFTSQYYAAIQYLSSHEIIYGIGNNQFDPDSNITFYQWALMFNRASKPIATNSPDSTPMTYGQLIESAFNAFNINVYSYELYLNGYHLSEQDNRLRVAQEFGLIEDVKASDYVCRGKAAEILYELLTHEYKEIEPPLMTDWPFVNRESVWPDEYLLQVQLVPEEIRARFKQDRWQFVIDYEYLNKLSEEYQTSVIGATSFSDKRITVKRPDAILHEFGHYLDWRLGFISDSVESEIKKAFMLREYARTSSREYFADYFEYWIVNHEDVEMMNKIKNFTPMTYALFNSLEKHGWELN